MTINLNKYKNELLFLPLGGAGEIGMNLNLYQLDGKWLIVDFGAGFADDYMPGVDMIVPDIEFLRDKKDKILGIILTHAHEDHLGAVNYIWDEVRAPVYATPFTANFLREKLKDCGFGKQVKINEVPINGSINLDPFKIEMVPITHSTPEMHGLVIRTRHGNIMHTGDWKFDHDPLIGDATDEELLKSYGDEGILAMIGDSTNVFTEGHSGSEGDLRKSLTKIISECKSLVAVTTFASNVARVETIIKAAEAAGRKVIVTGKSLWRIIYAAQESGYLKDINPVLNEKEFKLHARDELLILCTGCQGEPLAATSKIAEDNHNFIHFKPNDTIIFSSKIIPGNDKKIFRLFNNLIKKGVEVITEKDHFVHVSGHPAREELKRMYSLIRPKIAIPVHGEHVHMHEHVKLAKGLGVPHVLQIENGEIIKLAPDEPERIALIEAGYYGVDGNTLVHPKSKVMKMRRRLRQDGVITISLIIGSDACLKTDPIIFAPGCLDNDEDRHVLSAMSDEIITAIEDDRRANRKAKISNDTIENITRAAVRRILKQEIGKSPNIEVEIRKV